MALIKTRAAAIATLVAVACVPAEVDDDSIPTFDPRTTLAGSIQEEGVLVVGVEEDAPPLATGSGNEAEGFTVEMGRWLADGLGVDAEFVAAPGDELAAMVSSGDVDVAFPLTPITEDALEDHLFSDPYYVAHQRLLVPEDSAIGGVDDLAGARVCEFVDATGVRVDDLNPDVAASIQVTDPMDCLRRLERGAADAVSAPDIILVTLAARSHEEPKIVGDQLSSAGYGAMIHLNPLGLSAFIDSVFAEADQEGRWSELYARWIGPHSDRPEAEPPLLTFEQAAALNPHGPTAADRR